MLIFIQLLQTKKHLENIEKLETDHLGEIPSVVPVTVNVSSGILPH
jgi:hypothetical protein